MKKEIVIKPPTRYLNYIEQGLKIKFNKTYNMLEIINFDFDGECSVTYVKKKEIPKLIGVLGKMMVL